MVWWIIGILLIVGSIWLRRGGLKLYAAIALVLAIAALLTGYWTQVTVEDDDLDEPAIVEGGTPAMEEGGV